MAFGIAGLMILLMVKKLGESAPVGLTNLPDLFLLGRVGYDVYDCYNNNNNNNNYYYYYHHHHYHYR